MSEDMDERRRRGRDVLAEVELKDVSLDESTNESEQQAQPVVQSPALPPPQPQEPLPSAQPPPIPSQGFGYVVAAVKQLHSFERVMLCYMLTHSLAACNVKVDDVIDYLHRYYRVDQMVLDVLRSMLEAKGDERRR